MSGLVIQLALGNVAASAALAGLAWLVHRHGRYPNLAHVLWVLVLAKLITPPVLLLPLLEPAGPAAGVTAAAGSPSAWLTQQGVVLLLAAWAAGSAVVLVTSIVRIGRFDSRLRTSSLPAPTAIQAVAAEAGARLGLRETPTLYLVDAHIAPMTWWVGGRVWVVLPATLPSSLGPSELRWVIAHELAHVKRRDHVVRWLEWLACVAFWWNPVAWWARRNLHHDEEAACDALVLERLGARPTDYAGTLLAVVELLARPAARPPAVATGIDGGSLERRFGRILSSEGNTQAPRTLVVGALAAAVVLMPMGLGHGSGMPGPSTADASGTVAAKADAASVPFVIVGADDFRPVANVLPAPGSDLKRAARKLSAARTALTKADRAIDRYDAAPAKAGRRMDAATTAVRKAARAVKGLDPASPDLERQLRKAKRQLRELRSGLEATTD